MTVAGSDRRRRRLGLRLKLMLASLVLICTPVLVVWGIGLFELPVRWGTTWEVRSAAEEIQRRVEHHRDPLSGPRGTAWLRQLARDEHVLVRVLDRRGRVLLKTDARHAERWSHIQRGWYRQAGDFFFGPAGPPDLRTGEAGLPVVGRRPEVLAALGGQAAERWRFAAGKRLSVFCRAAPMVDGRVLYLTRYSRRSIRALYDLRYQVLKLTLSLAAVAALLGLWTGWRIVNPLLRIQRYIRGYLASPRGEGPPPPPPGRRDEIGDLGRDLQVLTTRLDERLEQTATMAGDLAHDLKNPIATVTASAELMQGERPMDEKRRRRIAGALGDAAAHMNRSVDGMLELARLDEHLEATQREEVDLAALVQRLAGEYRQDPRTDDIELSLDLQAERAALEGMKDHLARAVRNLVDNALVFCEGRIHLELSTLEDGALRLMVCDDGPGVSEGNRDKIFRRFFTSRPDGAPEGNGLGLAAVQAIARAHGGEVTLLEQGPLPGACFCITVPTS